MELFLSLVQDACRLASENVLPVTLITVLVGSVVWLLVAMIYQSKLAKMSKTAAEAIQSRSQMSEQLAQSEQVVQQLQAEASQQTARLAQIEQDKQDEIERVQRVTQQLTDSTAQCETIGQSLLQLQNALQQQQLETQQESTRAEALTAQLQQHKNSLNQSLQVLATFLEQATPSDTLDNSALWQTHETLLAETLARLTLHSSQYNELQETLHEANRQLNEQTALIENLEQELDNKNLELEQQALLLQARAVLATAPPVAIEPPQAEALTVEPVARAIETTVDHTPPVIDSVAPQTVQPSKEKAKPWTTFQRLYSKPTVVEKSEQKADVMPLPIIEVEEPLKRQEEKPQVNLNSVTAIAQQDFQRISQSFKGLYRRVSGKK